MLVVASTVRASLVRGSEATSDSQLSMSVGDNAPEDDNGATSVAEVESKLIELRTFSRSESCNGWGAAVGLEVEAPMTFQTVSWWLKENRDASPEFVEEVTGRLYQNGSTIMRDTRDGRWQDSKG